MLFIHICYSSSLQIYINFMSLSHFSDYYQMGTLDWNIENTIALMNIDQLEGFIKIR